MAKTSLWSESVPGLDSGSPALFIDLDVVIMGSLDPFFEHEGDFIVCENWTQIGEGIGNTSVYRFNVGSHPYLYEKLVNETDDVLSEFKNSQTYISRTINPDAMTYWPDEWCKSFKVHCVPKGIKRWFVEPALPVGTRIVAFPGTPNPHQVLRGHWPAPWYKKIYKTVRPSRWVQEHWR